MFDTARLGDFDPTPEGGFTIGGYEDDPASVFGLDGAGPNSWCLVALYVDVLQGKTPFGAPGPSTPLRRLCPLLTRSLAVVNRSV